MLSVNDMKARRESGPANPGGTMTTASEINGAIKAKYSGPEWRVWFEVSQGTGAMSGRRADAVVMNIWPSKAYQLHVFEVKVSRADFKQEMTDLTKSDAIGRYADFFWLAAPAGLVAVEEVPEAWGLMVLTKGGMRIKKQAPARAEPAALDRAFAASLLRAGRDLTEEEIEKRVRERVETGRANIQEMAELKFEAQITREKMRNDKLESWRRAFTDAYGVTPNYHKSPEQMADRIRLAEKLNGHELAHLSRQARDLADLIEKIET